MPGSALEKRAAIAFQEYGEIEYWETLSTGPRKPPGTNADPDDSDYPKSSDDCEQTDI
jgi:hypothetical protein